MMPTLSPVLTGAAPTRSVLLPAPPSRALLGGRLEPSAPPRAWPPRPPLQAGVGRRKAEVDARRLPSSALRLPPPLGQGPLPRPEPPCPGRAPVPANGVPHDDGRAGTRTTTTHLPDARPLQCVLPALRRGPLSCAPP